MKNKIPDITNLAAVSTLHIVEKKWSNVSNLSDSNEIWTHNHLLHRWTLNQLAKGQNDWVVFKYLSARCIWLHFIITSGTSFRVNQQSIVWVNVNDFLARTRHQIWSLVDGKELRTHSHLLRKGRLEPLAKLSKWLRCVVSTYLFGAFECMLLLRHVRVSEWI